MDGSTEFAVTTFGPQLCGDLDAASRREWLVTDGLGGYAMGTVATLRTRRYHAMLVVADEPPTRRSVALVDIDLRLLIGDRRIELSTHEWAAGAIHPRGHQLLASFDLTDGVPRWRWTVGDIIVERELAMMHGTPAVGVVHRVIRAPSRVTLEMSPLVTWRDAHAERRATGDVECEAVSDGFVFENCVRVRSVGFEASADWWLGAHLREEAARGLAADEDLFCPGTFNATLAACEHVGIEAWAGDLVAAVPPAVAMIEDSRKRARLLATKAGGSSLRRRLAVAADQFVIAGPAVIAGYPWFGEWSRDTFTSYEGLFLTTDRFDEGRRLLSRAAATVSEGMIANTADAGEEFAYNTADGTMWLLHAIARHVEVTGDHDLLIDLAPTIDEIVTHHLAGTRYGIGVDPADGLVRQGAAGLALTWMDARVDGAAVTPRTGKTVEINALWISSLRRLGELLGKAGAEPSWLGVPERAARAFMDRFVVTGGGLADTVDGDNGDDRTLRPNQLLAVSLPDPPCRDIEGIVRAVAPLVTPVGMRSLAPVDNRFRPHHQGDPLARDNAYHQGTVWPWLIGPYVDALRQSHQPVEGVLDGLGAHLDEWGLGSVSETADGAAPHVATGCPFQAWSVAEWMRVCDGDQSR
jgi:predicted glycogen debranching enzyme